MDTKRLITAIIVSAIVVIGWQLGVAYLDHKYPHWDLQGRRAATQPKAPAASPPAVNDLSQSPSQITAAPLESTTVPSASATDADAQIGSRKPGGLGMVSAAPSRHIIGSAFPNDATYAAAVELTSRGAGISSVTLNGYTMRVGKPDLYVFQQPYAAAADSTRPLATRGMFIDGQFIDTSGIDFALVEMSPDVATFRGTITRGGSPVLEVRKTYNLRPRTHESLGYEVGVSYVLKNLTDAAVDVEAIINGPITPPLEQERGLERHAVAGLYDAEDVAIVLDAPYVDYFTAKEPTRILSKSDQKLMWMGTNGAYFSAMLRFDPAPVAGAPIPDPKAPPNYVGGAEARLLNPNAPTATMHEVATQMRTSRFRVAAGSEQELPMRLYVGPKQRQILEAPYYATLPFFYDQTLVVTTGICALCTFQWLIKLLVGLLGVFHYLTGDWGIAIICLVLVVRAILHPVTKKSQVSMAKMGKMAPELERLKKKYGDDKEGFNQAQMQLMKEHGYGSAMLLGCIPMLLQMPIWMALWAALQSTFELRHAPLLYGFTWIDDLSRPDHLIEFSEVIRLPLGFVLTGFNVLPFLLGVVFWFQHKMTPKPPTMSPEQEQQAKMMQWMTLLFPVFLYSGPSGLNIYILTSTAFGILESKIIRDHLKRQEAAEAAGKVLVDAAPLRTSKAKEPAPAAKPATGLAGFLERLREQAKELQKQADEQRKRQGK